MKGLQKNQASANNNHAESIDVHERKDFIDFTDEDAAVLLSLKPLIEPHIPRLVALFYDKIHSYSELMGIIDDAGSSVPRLQKTMEIYLAQLFSGSYDQAYFRSRCKIGQVHNAIGLSPRWYLGAYNVYSKEITDLICKRYLFFPGKKKRALNAFYKVLNLDTQLVMDTYIADYAGQIEEGKNRLESKVKLYSDFIQKVTDGDLNAKLDNVDDDDNLGKLGRHLNIMVASLSAFATKLEDSNKRLESRVELYSDFIRKVSEGDLQAKVDDVAGGDALSVLGQRLNSMVENLSLMVGETREASNLLEDNLGKVQTSITSQTNGIVQQAAALNQTTSTMSEIRATSAENLEMAQGLGKIAEKTREESEEGKKVVEETVTGMEAIREKVEGIAHTILSLSEQTQQIGEITDVVDGLAQQLKMLALNASIEAAKAGDAGKGFGVVATEVKELADQSQQSTAQVQKILEDIRHATDRAVMATEEGSKGVDIGMELVNKTGSTMHKLSEVIQETSSASQQIVTAVRHEVTGIDQINTAITEINSVTSQFAESSDQTKTVADGLSKLAERLSNNVSLFKI